MVLFVSVLVNCATGENPKINGDRPSGWPVDQRVAEVSSKFAAPRADGRHGGIDLRAPSGTRVVATGDGRVIFVGRSGAFGKMVIIDHDNGWQTRYAHLKRISVKLNRRVQDGEKIGAVGKTGNATGYHLHYEVRRHGDPVDPWPLMTTPG